MRSPGRPTRRAVLAGLAAVVVAGCTSQPKPAPPRPGPARSALAAERQTAGGTRVMQILAHPDDDLYFMNPELEQSIQANDQVVSVYLNCGETGGVNKPPGKPAPKADLAGYAGARRQGLRQGYALMATGQQFAKWDAAVVQLPDGTRIEVDTLDGHPGVKLVFLGIHQHLAGAGGQVRGLPELWADPAMVTQTLPSTGSPVQSSHPVTRESLIAALVWLLDQHQPSLVRTMDLDPDMQVHDEDHNRLHHDQPGYADHPDHTAAAQFTYAALAQHRSKGHYLVTAYRGYYNERWPDNLPEQLLKRKVEVLNTYGGSPDNGCGFPAGCGDYDVGQNRAYGTNWGQRTTVRYPASGPAFQSDPDGLLTAFGVLGGQATMWRETAKGSGKFGEPQPISSDGLLPGLAALLTQDGRWQLFAGRIAALGPAAPDNRRELVMAQQTRKGGQFGAWTSLGNPEGDPDHGRRVGSPVVARNADGTAQLFVRNWAKGVVTCRQQPDGKWSDWTDLGGADVQEGLAAVTDGTGRIHLFAAGHDELHHWVQQRPNGQFTMTATGIAPPADPPAAAVRSDGSVQLVLREPRTARPLSYRLGADGNWQTDQPQLGGIGYGPYTLLPVGDTVLLATRNNDGGTCLATLGSAQPPRWTTVPGPVVGTAALAVGASGRPVVARFGPDAALHCSTVA